MSGNEKAGGKRSAAGDVIDVDNPHPEGPQYVSTFGERVRKLVEIFNSKIVYFKKDGKDYEHIKYNGVLIEGPWVHNACKRIRAYMNGEDRRKQEEILYQIIAVYNADELGDQFADAKADVCQLQTMMTADRPVQRAAREKQEQEAAAAVEKQQKSQEKQLQQEAAGAAAGKAPSRADLQPLNTANRIVFGFSQNSRSVQTDCMHHECVAAHVMTLARAMEISKKHGDECLQVFILLGIAAHNNCLCAIVHVAKALFCPLLQALLSLQLVDFDVKRVLREASESKGLGGAAGGAAGGKKRKGSP